MAVGVDTEDMMIVVVKEDGQAEEHMAGKVMGKG